MDDFRIYGGFQLKRKIQNWRASGSAASLSGGCNAKEHKDHIGFQVKQGTIR